MTTIRSRWDGDMWKLEVCGHAGYGETGRDIVCSAISMLCCALGKALYEVAHYGGEGIRIEREQGFYQIVVKVLDERCAGMIDMARVGFEMLAKQYPGNVKFYNGS